MAAKLGSLQIDISANVARIAKDMGKVTKTVEGATKKMTKAVNFATAAIVAMVGAEILRKTVSMVKEINVLNDSYAKMAQQTGVAVETLSAYSLGADLAGASSEILGKGLKTLAKNMNDASMGTGEAMKAFKELGISVKNNDGTLRKTEDVLADIADRFSRMENGAKKSAQAQLMLGRAGQQLIPFLNGGSKGLAAMRKEAEAFGTVVSGKVARQSELFNDNIRRMSAIAEGVAQDRIKPITLALNFMSDAFIKGYKEGGTLNGVLKTMKQTFKLLAGDITVIEGIAPQDSFTQLNIKIRDTVIKLNNYRRELKRVNELADRSKLLGTLSINLRRQQVDLARTVGETQKYYKSLLAIRSAMKGLGKESEQIKTVVSPFEGLADMPIRNMMEEVSKAATSAYVDYFYAKDTGIFGEKYIAKGMTDFLASIKQKAGEGLVASQLKKDEEEIDSFIGKMDSNVNGFSDNYKNYMDNMRSYTGAWQSDFNEAIVNMTQTGKLNFSDMVNNMLADLVRLSTQRAFAPFLEGIFGSVFSAGTGTKAPSKNTGNASGGIINQPTVMGGSWAGEKGTEAVMPLARIGGDLGVKATPSNVIVQVVDQRSSGQQPEVTTTKSGGMEMIKILIRDETNRNIRSGTLDGSMSSAFGLSRKGLSR